MHTSFLSNRLGRWLAVALLALLAAPAAQAQLSGAKAIPGDYATVAAAITALNAGGVGAGGVTFNVAAGYTETFASPTAGAITATGTSANPIVFQKAGTGANPLITAGVGTSTGLDAIISLSGSDYVTFNGIDVAENAANTTATTQMEFGYALFRPSATDGCQNNTIRNCVVTLVKTNGNTIGIAGLANPANSTTTAAASATSGANSGNKIYGNVVTNAVTGISFAASSSTTTANYDQNNEIGSATAGTGNTIGNFGGSASGWGAGGSYQNGLRIIGNTINSTLNYTSATASTSAAASTVTSTLRGIYCNTGTSSNLDVTGNTVTVASGATTSGLYGLENTMGSTAASNTVNITNNTFSATYTLNVTSGTLYGLNNTGSPATLNITGNTISNVTQAGTGAIYAIYNNHSATAANVLNNTVTGINKTGASGSFYGYYNNGSGAGTQTLTGNTITAVTLASSSSIYGVFNTSSASETQQWSSNQVTNITNTGTGSLYGLYCTYGAAASQFNNNTITGLSGGGTLGGLYLSNSSLAQAAVFGNVVGGLTTNASASSLYGIYSGSVTTVSIYRNKVYDVSGTSSGGVAYGIYTSGATTASIYNNLVGSITAPASTNLLAATGINIASGTTVSVYYNTVYLNASSSGATFGTSAVYLGSTSTTLDLRDNILVNTSTAVGTGGYTVAFRRTGGTAGTAPSNYASTSNNNLFYAGTPSATNLIYVEGSSTATNAQQTLAAYKAFMAPRDQASVTELPPFANTTTGAAATFLHIASGTATQVESGGTPVSSITNDYDNDTRNATTPDIGADEGSFTPSDQTPPAITYTALGNTSSTGSRTLTVTITDPSGVATGTAAPRLYYRVGTTGTYTSVTATSVSGSTYTFTIPGAATGSTVQYYVAAQDASPNNNAGSSPAGGTGTNPPGSTAPAAPNSYQILSALSGTYYVTSVVGSSPNPAKEFATLTAAAAAYNSNGLSSAVNFVLLDASYSAGETFPLVLNANPDASAVNTLTINPGAGVTATISGSVATGAVLKLNGADYVTIDGSNAGTTSRDLTITNTSATGTGNAVLWLAAASTTDGATFNTVKNTNIVGNSNTGFPQFTVFLGGGGTGVTSPTTSTPAANSNNTLQNNVINKGYYGVFVFGVSTTSLDQNNTVQGNQIGQSGTGNGFGLEGLRAVYQQGLTVQQNEIQNVVSAAAASHFGLNLGTLKSSLINRNSIHDVQSNSTTSGNVGYGISLANGTNNTAANPSANTVSNNVIYNISAPLASTSSNPNVLGIANGGGYGDRVVFNTILLNVAQTAGTGYSAAISNGDSQFSAASSALDVRNNIVAITANVTTAAKYFGFYTSAANVTGSTLDYNDYFLAGTGSATFAVGNLNGTSLSSSATLAAWQTATGQESHSVSIDPQFGQTATVPFNLMPSNPSLDNLGTPISGITNDYAGTTRSTTTPDIGAYEFTPVAIDLAPVALVAPATTSTCYGTAEAVTVSIRNSGASALNFASNPATVTVVVTLPGGTTQTLTGTVNTGTLASGATQTVTLPTTLNMSAAGTYSFAITATVQGDQNTSNDVLTTVATRTVTPPVAGTLSPAASAICVSGTASLTLAGAANGTIQYQSSPDNVTFTDIAGATAATYTTPVLTSTTYYRAQVRCNSGTATSNVSAITVNNPLVASTNTPVNICSGSTATLTATASTGANVRFFSAATGGTALATGGSYTTPALTANTTYYAEAFLGGTSVAGLADNGAGNGTFMQSTSTDYPLGFAVTQAGTLTSVDVYPTAAGTLTIRLYSVSGTQPAGSSTAVAGSDVTINVTAAQVGTRVTVPLNYALTPGDYKLSNYAGGLGRYSTYSGTYPLNSADGVLSVKGSYTFFSSTSYSNTTYNSFFNLTFSNECIGGASRTAIQVNVTQPATASLPAATATTCGTTAYQLAGTVGGGATTGTYTSSGTGTFTPNATTLNATYTPSAADVTAGSVTITLTAAAAPCAPATATLALSISPAPVASFSYPTGTAYCAGSTSTVAPTLGSGATAGTFSSTTGLSIDATTGVITLSTSTPGTYTVTNTVAASGPCAGVSATTSVTITPATSAAFAYSGATFCVSGSTNPVATVTGTAGGTFSSTTGLSLNASTGAITLSSSTPGTYTVTYTVAGACGSSSTQSVSITAAPVATFSYGTSPTYCVSGTTAPAVVLGTGASAGTFSSTTGLTINGTTGAITLSSSTPGTYTVTNTVAAANGCAAATATTTVTLTAAPVATFSYATAAGCVGSASAVTPTLGTGATAGTFSSTAGLTINATTGAITLASSTAGTYTVTNTVAAAGGCAAATATTSFTVNPRPATPTIAVAYNGSTTTLTSSATSGNQWSLGPNPVPGATGQTLVLTGLPSQLGSYTVTTTNANGCISLPSNPLVVTSAKNGIAGASLRVYPNPTPNGQVTLELTGYRLTTQLTVLDALGRVIASELLPANAGTATHPLNLTGVATGVYLLRLSNADGVETRRLVRD